jgi:capsular exopolysaccharide synthesis family protein
VPAEGKTFVTSNLAQSIVRQPDRHVLIVDGDMRCPRMHQALGAPQTPGLTDYLRGDVDEMSIIQSGGEGNLFFIGGGTKVSNPSELLSNGRLNALLKKIAPAFDWILIDAPPCLPVADATVIADFCDGILFVVRAGSTPAAVAQRAFQELRGRNILGVVLNAVEDTHAYGSTYYQSYGYGYGYS